MRRGRGTGGRPDEPDRDASPVPEEIGPQTVTIDVDRVLGLVVRVAVVLVACGTAVSIIRIVSGDPGDVADLGARFELYNDQTLPTWFSSILLLASVPLLAVMASRSGPERGRDRWHWAGLATMVAVFSVDEVATFHEYMSAVVGVEILGFFEGYNWVVFGIAFVVVAVAAYARFVLRLPTDLRRGLALGALLYFGGALGVEMLNAHTASTIGDQTYRYVLGTTVEESLELAGSTLVLITLLDHLRLRGHAVTLVATRGRR